MTTRPDMAAPAIWRARRGLLRLRNQNGRRRRHAAASSSFMPSSDVVARGVARCS